MNRSFTAGMLQIQSIWKELWLWGVYSHPTIISCSFTGKIRASKYHPLTSRSSFGLVNLAAFVFRAVDRVLVPPCPGLCLFSTTRAHAPASFMHAALTCVRACSAASPRGYVWALVSHSRIIHHPHVSGFLRLDVVTIWLRSPPPPPLPLPPSRGQTTLSPQNDLLYYFHCDLLLCSIERGWKYRTFSGETVAQWENILRFLGLELIGSCF